MTPSAITLAEQIAARHFPDPVKGRCICGCGGWPCVDNRDAEALLVRLREAEQELEAPLALAAEQAEDDGLWFVAETAAEAYLQQELRRLTASIEAHAVAALVAVRGDQKEAADA